MNHPLFHRRDTPSWYGGDLADDETPNTPGTKPLPRLHDGLPLEQILQDKHPTDAHSACYVMVDDSGTSLPGIPRIGVTGAVPAIRQAGGNLWMRAVAVDLDTEPHVPWESYDTAEEAREVLAQMLPHAATCVTQKGLRLIFKLQQLVSPEDFFKVASCAVREVAAALKRIEAKYPLSVDDSCAQWSRLFRLPNVMRQRGDSRVEDTSEYANLQIPSPWVPWFPGSDALRQTARELDAAMAKFAETSMPTTPGDGDAARAMAQRAVLVAPRYLAAPMKKVLGGKPFYAEGDRNNATFKLVASFFGFGAARGQVLPAESVFALFRDSVATSTGTDPHTALAETWSIIQRAAHKAGTVLEMEQRAVDQAIAAASDSARVPALVYTNKTRYVWNPLKRAYGEPISNDQTLLAEVTRHHPVIALDSRGKVRPMHAILRGDGVMVSDVAFRLGQAGSKLVTTPGGDQVLEVGVAPMVPVVAKFHPECADYLETVVASCPDGPRLIEWIATCGQLDHATPVLLLQGRASAGKSMIAEALAQLFGGKCEFSRVMGKFNAPLLKTALIHLDEGVDSEGPGSSVSNRFRTISANGSIDVEFKGVDPVSVKGNYRIIVTSNDPQPIPVANAKNLDGFHAIAMRVLPLYLGDAPKEFLERLGGKKGTADWVTQDVGGYSVPGRLAEHFAWIQETVKVMDIGGRFLVKTDVGKWHIQHLLQGVLRDVLTAAATGVLLNDDTVIAHEGQAWIRISQSAVGRAARLVKTHSTGDHTDEEILRAVTVGLKTEPPRRIRGQVYYPLPSDVLLALMEPEDADVFVEDAERFQRVAAALAASA